MMTTTITTTITLPTATRGTTKATMNMLPNLPILLRRRFAVTLLAGTLLAAGLSSPRAVAGPVNPAPTSSLDAAPVPAGGRTVVHRFALITGASQGGSDRASLRFAASDARAMQRVLSDLGGLGDGETILLLEAGREAIRGGFDRVKHMVARAKTPGARTEMIFYYSGHSDETGLLLGPERVSYAEVRAWVDDTGADVRIAVLDSCASGALTRGKGGVHRPPFLVDTSSAARGHAYLTASAENEAAQESDRLGAAYFTHYLVSGLRGAADVSHDGRVTLSEAYQYAFTETLARTEQTRGGPQHASYDFQLAGKGDLVMTDLRATSASLVLPSELAGRVYVRDAQGQLIAEVHKLPAQPILLGLPPGRYRIVLDDNRRLSETTIDLGAGRQDTLAMTTLRPMAAAETTRRGRDGADDASSLGDATVASDSSLAVPPHRALNLAIFPGFDTNGGVTADNGLVFGFVARSRNLDGLALTMFGHHATGSVRGTQIGGLGNLVGDELLGLQLGGIANLVGGGMTGAQIAGLVNWNGGPARGFQLAGIHNTAAGGRGVQLGGLTNLNRQGYQGAQIAGVANLTREAVRGAQVAGIANVAGAMEGVQLAVVNVGGDVDGAQIGVVNVARRVRGTQIGVIDVATESATGVPVGLVTYVRDGIHELELSTTEAGAPAVAGVLGTRQVYTRLGIGLLGAPGDIPGGRSVTPGSPADQGHFILQWGLGGRFELGARWFLDTEVIGWQFHRRSDFHQEHAVLGSARALIGFKVAPLLSVVLGPTYNVGVGWSGADLVTSGGFVESVTHSGGTTVRMYPGAMLGVRI